MKYFGGNAIEIQLFSSKKRINSRFRSVVNFGERSPESRMKEKYFAVWVIANVLFILVVLHFEAFTLLVNFYIY